ncbi:hypothetical protein [Boudabousia liubingyangii]|uniref:hypothetical protein n=1 Tax=Boudabousia liubingyangii TaxID=1921764 RepID=UPI001300F3FD|nr:hypothetical protein [Boudabousia liubingyangii]
MASSEQPASDIKASALTLNTTEKERFKDCPSKNNNFIKHYSIDPFANSLQVATQLLLCELKAMLGGSGVHAQA